MVPDQSKGKAFRARSSPGAQSNFQEDFHRIKLKK